MRGFTAADAKLTSEQINFRVAECRSATHRIWIAGDHGDAIRACRRFALRGACFAVAPVEYVFTMGLESGVCVTIINYPRFPMQSKELEELAKELGSFLCVELCQGSFSVEGPETTIWYSRRAEDLAAMEATDELVESDEFDPAPETSE